MDMLGLNCYWQKIRLKTQKCSTYDRSSAYLTGVLFTVINNHRLLSVVVVCVALLVYNDDDNDYNHQSSCCLFVVATNGHSMH